MSRHPFPNVHHFASQEERHTVRDALDIHRQPVRKALNVDDGMIVEAMAEPRIFREYPHLRDKFVAGMEANSLLMMVDLSPFSTVAQQLTAPQIARFLDRYYRSVVEAVADIKGIVEKYIGDAVLVIFGEPFLDNTGPDLLFDVVSVAKAIISNAGDWFKGEVSAKVAIAYGSCFYGYVGPNAHRELTIIGNPLTTLFRLEAECEPNQIILLTELLDQRPEERVSTLSGEAPAPWSRRKLEPMKLRGVSENPVSLTTITWQRANS